MNRINRGGMPGAVITAIFMVLLMSGTAFADGGRTLTFDSPEGQPQSGMPTTLVVRLLEGDHLVAGAQVFVAVTPTSVETPPDLAAPATPGDTPGEYVVSVVFPAEGSWRVWLMAEEGGEHTASAYEVNVAPLAGASASGASDTGVMEGMDHGAGSTATEAMEGMDHGAGSTAGAVTEGDGHSESESAAAGHGGGGGVNWWVISAFLAVITAAVVGAAGLKRRLRRQMALGVPAPEGPRDV